MGAGNNAPGKYDGANAQSDSPSPAITISGIEFSPASGNQDEEFVELSNPTSDDVDISDWSLTGGVEFTSPGGTVIPQGGAVYITPDKVAFRARATSPL